MSEDKRLRVHPEQRFDHPELQFDLNEVAAKLQAEPLGNRPHRQETIYHHGPLTVALFLFEVGSSMAEHEAKGTVTVQVLKGRLKMSADGQAHELPAGSLLVLAPGVRHDVQAVEASQMLLTVCLDQRESPKDTSVKTKTTLDVRTIPGPQRHPLIFNTFDSL
ncbi:MAG TPA: AraC family ligand binding domain-containing protein, partial [Tepidisphaeraceae bacterium]|nr:AraC family ligand binding domain-containing protein [Tepidisphaeraceae bacterium]